MASANHFKRDNGAVGGATKAASSRVLGSGEMADRIRGFDWASTPLGPIESWSKEFVTTVNLTLSSPSPARTMWGPDFLLVYNDAYRPFPGPRHPEALGKSAREVYPESWHVVGPLLESAMAKGETVFHKELSVPLPAEDGTRSHSLNYLFLPVFEEGQVAGLFGPIWDVTGDVIAAHQLQASEARATRILQSIGDAVIVTDAETRVTEMNPVAEALTGWSKDAAKGNALAEVFHIVSEETRQMVENPADKVKRTGAVVGLANHTVLISKNGRETAIDDSGSPIPDEQGELSGIVLVFRDIEKRRGAERERDRVTEQLSQVLEVTTDAIVGVDRDWKMAYLNPKAVEIYSAGRNLIGMNVWEAFPGAVFEGSPYVEHYHRAMNEGITGTFDAHYPEPLSIWLHIEVHPTRDGIVTFSRDITAEVAAREELKQQTEQAERQRSEIESVYRSAPIGLALFDTENFQYLRLNDRQAEFFGLKPEQVVGRTLTEMAPIEGLRELFEKVRGGEAIINYPLEGELATRPGEHRYWTVSYFPVIDDEGKVQAITAASLEITQQRKAELALIQSEKLAVVGRLAASIAHEINNPLESVTNLLYLAANAENGQEIRDYLETAQIELRRASAITNQTLRFHKQSTSPLEITCEEMIASVILLHESRIVNARVIVEKRKRTTRPVRCFEGEIRQVLSNLVVNAVDAMQAEGGRLLMRSRESRNWKTGEAGLVITVADTGSGMPAEVLKRIYEPFYTTKGLAGTGLGLWVTSEILTRHNGTLRVRSSQRPGARGTVFAVFLPFEAVNR